MTIEDEIKEITEQIQQLQIAQTALLARLAQAANSPRPAEPTSTAADPPNRGLRLGDYVRIRNPGPFQPVTGTIIKIGQKYITVQAQNGTKVLRAPKNLIRQTHHE